MTSANHDEAGNRNSRRRGLLFLVLILAGVGIGVGLSLQPSIPPAASSPSGHPEGSADAAPIEDDTSSLSSSDVSANDDPGTQTDALLPDDLPSDHDTEPAADPASAIPSGPRRTDVGYAVGQFAPGFSLLDLAGRRVSLASYRGQVVLLDFWASWCTPCRQTLPYLHQLAVDFASEGLVLIGINLDRRLEDAVSYLEDHPFPQLIPVQGTTAVALQYGVSGIPRTFLIDRSGIIRYAGHPSLLAVSAIAPWL